MSETNSPLGGFEHRLLGELRDVVERRAAARVPSQEHLVIEPQWLLSSALKRFVMAPRWFLASVGGAVACAVALIIFSAGSSPSLAQAFPAFAAPPTNVSGFLSGIFRAHGSTAANVDATQARAISTSVGTGYVATDSQANLICVATPGFTGDWGADCSTVSQAKRYGVGGTETYDSSGDAVAWAEVLPAGATVTARDASGNTTPLSVTNGVLSITVHHLTYITTTINRHASTTALATQSECDPVTQQGPDCKVLDSFQAQQRAAHSRR